ncbi:MAG: ABC transporter permease subunit [Planctomycetes bacterium]|nr:ABC transporter permease subunit [Planctomycetota bacterium]
MIRQIIYREILENLLSLRFILSLLLAVSLFATAGFVFAAKYRQESQDYWKNTNENLSNLSEQTKRLCDAARYKQTVYRKPKALALCTEGFEKYFPNYFRFNIFSMYIPGVKSRDNFDLGRFSDMDLVFIISLILSFIALIFTYDTICGEKEAGTLRLILSASIHRHKILIGKYAGVMFTLGIPLLLGLLVNLLIVISSRDVVISAGDWYKILTIVLLSFLYLSIFVLLGLFVSSRTAHSANSMVILLLVWVGLVILIPSFGRIISDTACKSPTEAELQRRLTEVDQQIEDDLISGKFGKNAGAFSQNPEKDNPPGTVRLVNARRQAGNQVREDHLNKMTVPLIFGRHFTRLSPTVIYQCSSEAIAGIGITRFKSLYQQVKRYQQDLKEYVRSKDAQDPDSLHLLCDHGQAISDWGVMSKKPVSFDSVPKFQERDLALGQSLKLAVWDIGLLILFNLVFFAAAYVSFLRYDVR